MRSRKLLILSSIVLLAGAVLFTLVLKIFWHDPGEPPLLLRDMTRSELTLRDDGRLYAADEKAPFNGLLFENFPGQVRKVAIDIRDGKPDGRSLGYFESGQLEVEEFFIKGVSHGLRTRWDESGRKKSTAQIEHGKLNGLYVEWHPNGKKALEMTLRDGKPEGAAEAWHPDGKLKSRTRFAAGKIVDRKFFPGGA